MAATRYIGITAEYPQVLNSDVVGAASGGTLAGSQILQVVFDDTIYTATPEGKQRLLAALEVIADRIETAHAWPIGSTS